MHKIYNKQAKRNYFILETLEAGLVLTGAEVKSVRSGRVDLNESFAKVQNGEAFLKNAHIFPLNQPMQGWDKDRKLLLKKNQINSLVGKISKLAVNLIPLSIYSSRNFIKVELALAASKKKFDKRRALKEKDAQRRVEQELKGL